MGNASYKIKNMFKSKERRELEAKILFNRQKRDFEKYYKELSAIIKEYTEKAKNTALEGNHQNALSCAKFVLRMQHTQVKVQGLLQRYQMMYSMQRLANVMTNFMDTCAKMSFKMNSDINLKKMMKSTASMDEALNNLDAMADQMDEVFNVIDGYMDKETLDPAFESNDAAAQQFLNQIMHIHNIQTTPDAPMAHEAPIASEPAVAEPSSDVAERIRRLKQELEDV